MRVPRPPQNKTVFISESFMLAGLSSLQNKPCAGLEFFTGQVRERMAIATKPAAPLLPTTLKMETAALYGNCCAVVKLLV
jgi:hypothetical protein